MTLPKQLPDVVIKDVDESTDFDGGFVLAQLIAVRGLDQLSILESGGISLSGNLVQYTVDSITTEIGAIDNSFDGVNQNDLKIHLSQHATHEATQALIRAIAYHNTSDDPSSGLSNNDRTVRFILNDGGNTSGIDPVDQADSALVCSVDVSIIFTSVNDAPSLTYSVGGTWSEAISGDSDPLLFLSGASANDIDEHYNGGSIQIDLDEYFTGDRLIFVDGNGFTSSNGSIALNGVEVATIDASYDGTDKAFKINTRQCLNLTEELLEQIGYNSVSHNATNSGLLPTRSVSVTLRDGGNEGIAAEKDHLHTCQQHI